MFSWFLCPLSKSVGLVRLKNLILWQWWKMLIFYWYCQFQIYFAPNDYNLATLYYYILLRKLSSNFFYGLSWPQSWLQYNYLLATFFTKEDMNPNQKECWHCLSIHWGNIGQLIWQHSSLTWWRHCV